MAPANLLAAARDGDVAAVKRFLAEGVDPDLDTAAERMFAKGNRTGLMWAAQHDHLAVVRVLLAAGANVNRVDHHGDTAVCKAAAANSLRVVKALLAAGAKHRPRGAYFTPLYSAAVHGHVALAKWLLSHGARVDERIWTKATPLTCAVREGQLEIVALLLAHGANVNIKTPDGYALHRIATATFGDVDDPQLLVQRIQAVMATLLAAGARTQLRDAEGHTALELVIARYHDMLDVVRTLLASGAIPPNNAVPIAARVNAALVVAELVDHGCGLEAIDDEGFTALELAAQNGYANLTQLLLDVGAKPRRAASLGRSTVQPILAGERIPLELPSSAAHVARQAVAAYQHGKYKVALALFEWLPKALREGIPAIASNMAYCFQQTKQHGEALRHFALALERAPHMTHAILASCFSAYALEQWSVMHALAQSAVQLEPESSYAWQQLQIATSELGDHATAIEHGRRALALNKRNGYAMSVIAMDERELGHAKWVKTLRAALKLEPALARDKDIRVLLKDRAYR